MVRGIERLFIVVVMGQAWVVVVSRAKYTYLNFDMTWTIFLFVCSFVFFFSQKSFVYCRLQRCAAWLVACSRGASQSGKFPLNFRPQAPCTVSGYLRPAQGDPGDMGDAIWTSSGRVQCRQTLQVHTENQCFMSIGWCFASAYMLPLWIS